MLGQTKSAWRPFPPIPARDGCSLCGGTGWELVSSNGSATARRCPCVALTRAARLTDRIRIPERHRECTLESYRPVTVAQTRGLAEAWRFVEHFPDVERGIVLLGGAGTGKTHLAVGVLLELADRFHEDTLFVDFRSMPGLHWSLGGAPVTGDPTGSKMRTVSLLVLDNFGPGHATESQYSAAIHILHARMRGRRPTICTARSLESSDAATPHVIHQAHALLLGAFKVVALTGEEATVRAALAG